MRSPASSSHAPEVQYALHTLGWKAFQDLCLAIVSEVLGQSVQAFLPMNDGGRDGAFYGTWLEENIAEPSNFTVQCKYSSRAGATLAVRDVEQEVTKAQRLAASGFADVYILLTNLKLSGRVEEDLRSKFLSQGVKRFLVFGYEWITLKIRESARLRMLVPRVYGLGDLSQIFDERALAQAGAVIDSLGDDLSKFVITDAHRRSAKALVEHGFVLLLGEPASGKSTIAASLAVGAIDVWGCNTYRVRNADDFIAHWNPHDPKQFFWIDDAFGATQYQRSLVTEWNRALPHMMAAIPRGARVLFTSRDYIYASAREDLKITAFPLLAESQVVINVQQLSLPEKQQILYNHIKLGNQTPRFKQSIKSFLPAVAENRLFLPETARRLGNSLFTRNLLLSGQSIASFVEKPLPFLMDVVRNLDVDSRAALAMLFIYGGYAPSPLDLTGRDLHAIELLGSTSAGVRKSLNAMNGSLVKLLRGGGATIWTYRHPTVGDALAAIVAEDVELLDIYLHGTSAQKLAEEITCGTVRVLGAKVNVPISRYGHVLAKVRTLHVHPLSQFLATRCDKAFIEYYLAEVQPSPSLFCTPIPYLSTAPEIFLLNKLMDFELLPELWRSAFVKHVTDLALEIPDADFLTVPRIRRLLRDDEVRDIVQRVEAELIPNIDNIVDNWRYNYDRNQGPESYFEPLGEALRAFASESTHAPSTLGWLDKATEAIAQAVEDISEAYPEPDDDDGWRYESRSTHSSGEEIAGRSVFDDVDM